MNQELRYTIPPDVLHYEARYFLGFGITELLIGTFAGLFGMMAAGTPGLLIGAVVLLGVRRFEGLGHRSLLEYAVARLLYEMRRPEVVLPRVLPYGSGRIEVRSWDGEVLYTLESEG